MNKVQEVKSIIEGFTREEFSEFRDWFDDYREEVWDKQIEEDAKAGRLDFLIARAKEDMKNGRCRPIEELCDEPNCDE